VIDHEADHAPPSALGPPFLRFALQDTAGYRLEVSIWAPPPAPWEGSTFRGWLLVEGHPRYDPPGNVLGEGPWQPVWLALQTVERYARERGLARAS
jgi:hypothetical protein